MAEPFVGEIIGFAGNFAPRGYAKCDGQLLAISTNTALFSLLGTFYGGNGQNNFALPDLRGRTPVHQGNGPGLEPVFIGEESGTETAVMTLLQMPAHTHVSTFTRTAAALSATTSAGTVQPPTAGYQLARPVDGDTAPDATPYIYVPTSTSNQVALAASVNVSGTVTNNIAGSTSPFAVRSPFLAITMCIALNGVFPTRN